MSRIVEKFNRHILPNFVLSKENGVNNTLNAVRVLETAHGFCSSADFPETTLDNVGSTKLAP